MRRIFPHSKMGYHLDSVFLGSTKWMNECKNFFLEWRSEIKCFYVSTKSILCEGMGAKTMQAYQILVWPQTSTATLIWEVDWAFLKLNSKHYDLDDVTLFVKKVGKIVVYLVVYVDDLPMTGKNENYNASIKERIEERIWDDKFGIHSLLSRYWSNPTL